MTRCHSPFLLQAILPMVSPVGCQSVRIAHILASNKTRQGYVRKCILKPAGYFFVRQQLAAMSHAEGAR